MLKMDLGQDLVRVISRWSQSQGAERPLAATIREVAVEALDWLMDSIRQSLLPFSRSSIVQASSGHSTAPWQ